MGELARLFGQLTPVKYPSLSPVACSKSSLAVPVSVRGGLRVILFDAFVWIVQQLKLSTAPHHTCSEHMLVGFFLYFYSTGLF